MILKAISLGFGASLNRLWLFRWVYFIGGVFPLAHTTCSHRNELNYREFQFIVVVYVYVYYVYGHSVAYYKADQILD